MNGVMSSLSSARQSEVKAWEEEITACEHTLMLEQFDVGKIAESGPFTFVERAARLGLGLRSDRHFDRPRALQILRPQGELVALSDMRLLGVRSKAVWRSSWR